MKTTATTRLKRHLLSGKAITQLQALDRFGIMRLGARIYDFKKEGMAISTEAVTKQGKTFARYKILA